MTPSIYILMYICQVYILLILFQLSAQSVSHQLTPLLYIFPQNEYLLQSSVTWLTATAPNVISMHMLVKSLSFSPSQSFPPSLPCFYLSSISVFFLSGRYLDVNIIPNTTRIDHPLSETSFPPGFFIIIIVSPIFVRHPVSTLQMSWIPFFSITSCTQSVIKS